MLFEDLLLLIGLACFVFLIGIPVYKLIRLVLPGKRNPLKEAQERLQMARLEAEAARLNKEAEQLYDSLYQDSIEDEHDSDRRRV